MVYSMASNAKIGSLFLTTREIFYANIKAQEAPLFACSVPVA
jgi:hypothetical protein